MIDSTDDFRKAANRAERGHNRDSLLLMARFRRLGEKDHVDVRVRNLSEGGLMAELPYPVEPDAEVEVELRGLGWIRGRIAWHTEGRTGIAFDKLIDPQRARKPVASSAPAAPFVKSILPRR